MVTDEGSNVGEIFIFSAALLYCDSSTTDD